mgnify:CR=1 FL=1
MGFFDFFKKKPVVSIKTEEYVQESFSAKNTELTRISLGGYTSPSGGYQNWTLFKVQGKNPETGRKNTRKFEARNESAAVVLARESGLVEPFNISTAPHNPPTEGQIEYLKSWGVLPPDGCSRHDISAIIDRFRDSTDVISSRKVGGKIIEIVRPLPSPSEGFAAYANDMGLMFSLYISQKALFGMVVDALDNRDKAALFAYCSICRHDDVEIGDPRESEHREKIYAFADSAVNNEAVMQSIMMRGSDGFVKPHKGSIAYKSVIRHMGIE